MKKKDATLFYGLCMATYSIGYVTLSAFSSLFLLDLGLSNGSIGILLAIASLVSVLLQPPVGSLIDRNPKISTRNVLMFLSVIIFFVGILIISLPKQGTGIITVLYGFNVMVLMLAQPFLNALGMDAINYGYPIKFGIGRSMGSLGYALGSAVFGRISVMAGAKSVPIAFSIAFLVMVVVLYLYPVRKDGTVTTKEEIKKENPFLFLGRYKRFAAMLVGLVLIYFSHVLINTFTLQIVLLKNGTSSDMGAATSLAAVCELITMLLFPFYMKKFKLHKLLRISGIFFTLKIFCSFLVTSMASFYAIQVLQMFSWGIMNIGIVYYVNNIAGEHDKAQGQAYAGMAYTVASVIGTFLGGNIIDAFGINAMLLFGTVLALIGTVVVWVTIEDRKNVINE